MNENKNKENLLSLLEELKEREVFSNCANIENFLNLKENEKTIYWGIDCTSDSLHIGHLSSLIQILRFCQKGFKIVFVLGCSTTTIGDPSDKLKERPILKKEVIEKNFYSIKKQLKDIINRKIENLDIKEKKIPLSCFYEKEKLEKIYKVLGISVSNFEQDNLSVWKSFIETCLPNGGIVKKQIFLNNEDWLSNLNFLNFINSCGREITVNYLLSKETIRQRIESENGISFSEFSYSMLQGYDFMHLYENYNCNGQVGASDQWGNFTTGLKIIKSKKDSKNKSFAISFNLMLNKEGKKISKSDNKSKIIWISKEKTPFKDLFDYFNNMSDEEVIKFVIRFTSIKKSLIEKILEINNPKSLRILQRMLIEIFFFMVHGKEGLTWIREKEIKIL